MMFDNRRIAAAAGEDVVKIYDKTDGHQWDCGPGAVEAGARDVEGKLYDGAKSLIERVRIKEGFLVEGRHNGAIGVWSC